MPAGSGLISKGCQVCMHPSVDAMEAAMRAPKWTRGSGYVVIARDFGVSASAVRNHKANHLDNPEYAAKVAAYWIARLSNVEASLG